MSMIRPLLAIVALGAGTAHADVPRVVVDIAPIHSIAARVMAGLGEPQLLLPPGTTPHDYALRPSDARSLQDAHVVFWIGPSLTPWLADPLVSLAEDARVVSLENAPGVMALPVRTDRGFEVASHDDQHGVDDHAEALEHNPAVTPTDAHLWLDPQNAVAFAREIAATLAFVDRANAKRYRANAMIFADAIEALRRDLLRVLAPVRTRPFLVFHDAYQYFERSFDLSARGSVALQEGVAPGAGRLAAIRTRLAAEAAVCAFSEPQFAPGLLETVVEGTATRTATLDPLGAGLTPGPQLYPELLRALTDDLVACLDR